MTQGSRGKGASPECALQAAVLLILESLIQHVEVGVEVEVHNGCLIGASFPCPCSSDDHSPALAGVGGVGAAAAGGGAGSAVVVDMGGCDGVDDERLRPRIS